MNKPIETTAQRTIIAALMGLGAFVMVGWKIDSAAITNLNSNMPTMKFNTALCMFLSGISLGLLQVGKSKASRVPSILTAGIALATLLEQVFDSDFGIDLLFSQSVLDQAQVHPGRMIPVTALILTLSGVALWIESLSTRGKWSRLFVDCSAFFAVTVGGMTVLGWAIGLTVSDFLVPYTAVAAHTGLGFCLLGAGVRWQSQHRRRSESNQNYWSTVPLLSLVFLCIAPLLAQSREEYVALALVVLAVGVAQAELIQARRKADEDREALAIAQKELAASADLLERTGRMAKIGGWELDLSTGRVTWSKETGRLHEVDSDYKAPLVDTGDQWYPPDEWPKIKGAVEAAIKELKPYDLESKFITAKGRNIWVRVQGFPVIFEGKVVKLQGTFQDITERKQRELENDLATRSLGYGIWKYDPIARELEWDQRMYELYGIDPKDFSGAYSAWESALSPDAREQAVMELEQALRGEKDFNTEFEIRLKNGDVRYIATCAAVVRNEKNEPLRMYGLNWDVTQRVLREKELKAANIRLLQSSKLASLGEMSAGVAHEINNPLAIIVGAVAQLAKLRDDPEKFNLKIESIKKSCDRIGRIVKGLKKFSRTGSSGTFKPVALSNIVHETLILTEPHSKAQDTPVSVECSTQALIMCDEIEIEQVLVNLINNGIDAVKSRPDRWVKLSVFEDAGAIVLRVKDSGKGIPETVRDRLFDPFYTTKDVGEGTGLGLSITKGILDGHKATIAVLADEPNTCFEVRFPRIEEAKSIA